MKMTYLWAVGERNAGVEYFQGVYNDENLKISGRS